MSDYRHHTAALTALYGRCEPTAEMMLRCLPELAESLHTRLCEAARAPSVERCEQLAQDADGLRLHLLRLAQAIRAEATPPEAA